MLLQRYSSEIESLAFQIQYSVVGGLKILQMAMDRHPTLNSLRLAISDNTIPEEEVFERILFLLGKVDTETKLSYDESVAAYLFCLLKEKPFTAYRASWSILDHGGLWWSIQLAHFITQYNGEIIENFDYSTESADYDVYMSSDADDDAHSNGFSVFFVAGDLVLGSLCSGLQHVASFPSTDFTWGNKVLATLSSHVVCYSSPLEERQHAIELVR